MREELKEQLVLSIIRVKRADSYFSSRLQTTEMVVMFKASEGCLCDSGMCVSDIHEAMHISKPAVSQILNNLEKRGLINRTIDRNDRRKISVTLTPEGDNELRESMDHYEKMLDAVVNAMGREDAEVLVKQINRLMDILEQF